MNDFSFRYGKKLSDKFAFKLVGGYLKADDWNASDYRNKIDLIILIVIDGLILAMTE